MTGSEFPAVGRELALTLADTLSAALSPRATPEAFGLARDAAQLLSLDGLDMALAACEPHAGHTLPADIAALAERLTRLVAECRVAGDASLFRERDMELRSLAEEVAGFEWSESEPGSPGVPGVVATLGVNEVLEELAIANEESRAVARRSRLTVPVAAALRAALDWLCPEQTPAAVRLLGEPSSLEVRLDRVRRDRLTASHRVIADVGGNLGPAPETDAAGWIIRVPGYATRVTWLTAIRGGMPIAIPWHAVLKIRMTPARDIVTSDRPLDHQLLEGVAPPSAPAAEHPVVLIGHGLKRGYLPVDRIVWRMTAVACDAPDAPAGMREAVESDDGDRYWVADPARLLEHVDVPAYDTSAPLPGAPPMLTPGDVVALPEALSAAAPTPPPAASTSAAPSPPPVAVITLPHAIEDAGADPLSAAGGQPFALIAEDSITARLFLARLLEQLGFTVAAVSTQSDLLRRLPERPWALILSDVELPDAPGADGLRDARAQAAALPMPAPVVALVRDRADLDAARAAGVDHTLLKPIARDALLALIVRLGLAENPS